ncbi:putative F-box domain-containing protein [Helianthus annuus]|uniref:F-box domain-containing protein n=1 Tax=Helianthus annuus TaxID=4232 RepID=A0A9K3DX67_HELAN|nr:putative F-box domain-containing protein [Helianthus annuus]KAJ0823076.1 putative F-box domain-containing protein [Helianthus annuus]
MERVGMEMVVEEILSRLPSKTVGRFRCACKQWRYELSTHMCAIIHARQMANSQNRKLITFTYLSVVIDNVVDGKIGFFARKNISFPIFTPPPLFLNIIASLYGFLLISTEHPSNKLLLWNPTTTRCLFLLHENSDSIYLNSVDTAEMYLDASNDLKILHIKRCNDVVVSRVYSRCTGTWRTIDFLKGTPFGSRIYTWSVGTLSNNKLYFTVSHYWLCDSSYIIAFDVNSEVFNRVTLPQ